MFINPDEEIGSPGSRDFIIECARRNDVGLVFEPSLPDGSLVSSRKGSVNFTLVARGKAGHAGREFHREDNAITKLAHAIVEIESLTNENKGITVNIGQIEGGIATNIVPDLALTRFNVRVEKPNDLENIKQKLLQIVTKNSLELHQDSERPPKPFDTKHRELFEKLKMCAQELGSDLNWIPSGGVCDGNLLASEGLITIDTLGPVGGNLHTREEYINVKSLTERAKLVFSFLEKLI